MLPTGIIFAALDCDSDAIEAWNRWYDLEHTPPNLSLDGVQLSRRYVAPPRLHDQRIATASAFKEGRSAFLTIYSLCGDPMIAFKGMTALREELVAADRMGFPDDKKIVREGDVMRLDDAVGDPSLKNPAPDVPFVGHAAINVIQRRSTPDASQWYRQEFGTRAVALDGIHAVLHFSSLTRPGTEVDLVLVEGDAAEITERRRAEVPQPDGAGVILDGAFELIDPLRYPFAEVMRGSWLPQTVRPPSGA